jgi:hypothetical protein
MLMSNARPKAPYLDPRLLSLTTINQNTKNHQKKVHKDNHNGHLLHLNATRENNLHVPFTKVLVRFNHVCLATRLTLGDDEGLNRHLIPTSNLGSRKAW